jgi:hypothetical protein
MFRFERYLALCLIPITISCAASPGIVHADHDLPVTVVMSSLAGEGMGNAPGAAWLDNEKDFLSCMAKLNRIRLGGEPAPVPKIDFAREGVLAIWMGPKPTGGYGIELASDKALIQGRTAVIKVRWIEPAKGAILAQRITSPCLIVRLAKGDYDRIKVMDENGIVRAETEVVLR